MDARSQVDGLPVYRGGSDSGGRFGALVTGGIYGAGNSKQAILELKGNPWPPLPVTHSENQNEWTLENQLLKTVLEQPRYYKKEKPRRDTTTLKDITSSIKY